MNAEQMERHSRHWLTTFSRFTTPELQSKLSTLRERANPTNYDYAVQAELDHEIDRRERLPMSKRVK